MTTLRCDGPLPGPTGMTVGADGAVWFSTLLGGYLGRIDPGNLRIERIDLPHGWAGGLMWATLSLGRFGNGQLIGIDPDDMTVAESFALGFGSFPCGLTRAPDGALWLGEPVRGNVARIDPLAGEVRRYPVRALGGRLRTALGSFPTYLNTRPDHAIWITQHLVPWIARIDA